MRIILFILLPALSFGQVNKSIFFVMSNSGTAPAESVDYAQQGYDFLVANARTFHDFSQLAGSHGSTITVSEDLTANNRDLTNNPGGFYTATAPTVFDYRYYNLDVAKTHYAFNNNPLMFYDNTTNAVFSTSHEIHLSLAAKSKNFILRLFGINSTQVHYAQIETDGKISLFIKRSTTTTRLRSVNPVFTQSVQNGDLGSVIALSFRYNFTAGSEEAKMYINGVEIATELVSGDAVASWNSAYSWNNLYSFAVGAEASATNTVGNSKAHWNYKFAVTGLLTQDQRNLVVHQMLSTPAQSSKLVLLADSKMPIATGNKTYQVAAYLSEEPATDVTVNITGDAVLGTSSLTFTPANYNVPQRVTVLGTTNFGRKEVDLTFTMTGGFSGSVQKEVIIAQSRTGTGGKDGTDVYLTDGWNSARLEADNITISSASALRDSIKTTLFKGDYPSGGPEATTTPTSYMGVTLANANAGAKNRYTFTEQDEGTWTYTNYVAHVRNTSPNEKLFIQLSGHGEAGHQALYDSVIAQGWDWAGAGLMMSYENISNNPNLDASPSWLSHDQLFTEGVDTETFDARRLFLFDKIRFLDYILTQYPYTEVVVAGVSGGGWASLFWAQFDDRINKVFCVRGVNSYNTPDAGNDFEQGPSAGLFDENRGGAAADETIHGPRITADYRNLGYLKRMALVCVNGAELHHMSHELDPLGGAYYNEITEDLMPENYFIYVNTNAGQSTHGFQADDISYIISNL